ncbi:hypothetical protein MSG28_004366 [Choristoneura fumiferana]|uniref:Uncharacterized protein n=1 Tax=Choristoneura fumiferana TaxID=7141 RepID=A0ACC0KJ01_CHOFU|nr:hypothetical protein MSG28_004366 [Choristoneura fumiferana]
MESDSGEVYRGELCWAGRRGAPAPAPPLTCNKENITAQQLTRTLSAVTTESLFSTSLSTFGVPTPPPNSPLQLELLNCSQRLLLADKDPNKMDDTKLSKPCLSDNLCCPGEQRQLIDGIGVMQPLTIKTEQAKRSCNTCLTNSPKKMVHSDSGCSRTNPVTWLGVAGQNVQVQVKREPQHVHMSELVAVKLEQASPGTKPEPAHAIPASLNNVTTESLFSTSLSTFGVPTPPPNSPLQLELLNCSQRLLLADKDPNKMDDTKLSKPCLSDNLCCPGEQRQLIDGIGVMQPLTIKTEQAKRSCNTCLTNSPKKMVHSDSGCSRTNPVTWLGVAGQNVQVQVKREPQHVHMSELVAVKLEQASPGTKPEPAHAIPASLNNGSIPVGIAVARQRVGDAGLLAALSQKDAQQRLHDLGE